MRTAICIVGLAILVFIVANWTYALGQADVGRHVPAGERSRRGAEAEYGETWHGLSPEAAAVERSRINTTYGLWTALVLGGTAVVVYLMGKGQKKAPNIPSPDDVRRWLDGGDIRETDEKEKEREVAELKARLEELEKEK